ncbi:MAG: helix-turn-helix domain-containing protein [Terriglobia bacterium]
MNPAFRTPAQVIEAQLEQRGWSQRVLAKVLGLTETKVSNIMNNRSPVTTQIALQLQAVLGINADELLALQTSFELAKAQLEFRLDPEVESRAKVFGDFPIPDIIKRGWLPGITDMNDPQLQHSLCKFFGVVSIDDIQVLPHAAKKTAADSETTPAQLAWLYRVRQLAMDFPAPKYLPDLLSSAVLKMKPLLISADGVRKVPRLLMECGVRYIIVESLPASKIDGVCFWLSEMQPVIGMTLRFDRIDNFWFVLRHEIEHVLCGHGKSAVMLDMEMERASTEFTEEERVANVAAADFCVPKPKLDNFIARKSPSFTERDIRGFAATMHVHPGIVAGQLQRHTGRYDLFRNHLAKVRSIVTPNAEFDGWGDVAQAAI